MPGSGCKTLWISLLLAIFFIVLTIALSLLSGPYTVSVAEAKASAQGAWRIDATVEAIALQPHFAELSLCSDGVCMTARHFLRRRGSNSGAMSSSKAHLSVAFLRSNRS